MGKGFGVVPTQTRGERVALLTGGILLTLLFAGEVLVGWGLNTYWIPLGLGVGLLMLAIAALVDRAE